MGEDGHEDLLNANAAKASFCVGLVPNEVITMGWAQRHQHEDIMGSKLWQNVRPQIGHGQQ